MIAIRNYGDTKSELEIARNRLNILLDKKEILYSKYFSITPNLSDDKVQNSHINNDKMAEYVHQITKINKKTGMSLEQEIEHQRNIVGNLTYYINLMERNLKSMKSIEHKLYYAIVVEGLGVTKAIDKVSFDVDKDVRTMWRYYDKIEKEIKKLEISQWI